MQQTIQVKAKPNSITVLTPAEYETKEYKSFYKTIDNEKCMYPTRLDTYGCGCVHDCKYCYAKSNLEFRNLWFPKNPRVADIGKIEKKIQQITPGSIVRLGGMTDCFQPLELKRKITVETIKLLNKRGVGYLIVTKSPIVAYPDFLKVMDKDLAHIQVTVTCLDYAISKNYEVAPPPEQRIGAILTLQKQGFDTAIRLSPLLEEYMDFDELNGFGIDNCIVEFMRINHGIKKEKWFPSESFDKYTLFHGNYRHLPLDEKHRIISKVKIPSISVCEKVPEHYDYWIENFNPNKEDCCNLRIHPQQNVIAAERANPFFVN